MFFIYKLMNVSGFLINLTFYETDYLGRILISHRMCSVRKGVPRNFAKLTVKHLCQRDSDTVVFI